MYISIHAPREGGDFHFPVHGENLMHFNPRPPRGGRLGAVQGVTGILGDFNPRPPRGGRLPVGIQAPSLALISIHAPREGGDSHILPNPQHPKISIHAPREGGDPATSSRVPVHSGFQSTPPARGATTLAFDIVAAAGYFNPRPPRGGRLLLNAPTTFSQTFQSTPPARGATLAKLLYWLFGALFQSTPPARGATEMCECCVITPAFQSTPPARGATAKMHSFTCGSLTNK